MAGRAVPEPLRPEGLPGGLLHSAAKALHGTGAAGDHLLRHAGGGNGEKDLPVRQHGGGHGPGSQALCSFPDSGIRFDLSPGRASQAGADRRGAGRGYYGRLRERHFTALFFRDRQERRQGAEGGVSDRGQGYAAASGGPGHRPEEPVGRSQLLRVPLPGGGLRFRAQGADVRPVVHGQLAVRRGSAHASGVPGDL